MRKIRILYMDMLWGFGGIETYILNNLDRLDMEKFAFDIALPGLYKHVNEDALTIRGVNVIHYEANSIRQEVQEVKKILYKGNYDIVHIMQNYVSLESPAVFSLVAIRERRKYHYKVINHAHNTEDTSKPTPFIKWQIRRIFRNLLRKRFIKADLLAACSNEAGEFLYGNNRNVDIFYNGIDIGKFGDVCTGKISQWREKYGIDANKMNFVAVGRMAKQKNPLFALDVVKALCQYYPDLRFTWVGDGEMRTEMEARMKEIGLEGRVRLLGVQDHVEEILACCDYFLLPSKREGLGIVFIEAQAAGLRCFSSDNVPALADCGGVTFISLDKTAEQWAAEIHRQIEAEPKANIDMERLSKFDINRTAADLSEVYKRLVER